MILSVVLVTILYVLVMLVSTGVIPIDALGASSIPVADVITVYLGPAGVIAIVFAAVIAAISSSNSSVLAASRVVYAMGRDGIVSEWLNASHPRFFTPHRAILVTGGVIALLVSVGLGVDAIISLLAEAASFSFLVAYSLVHVSLVVFRRADPDEYDPSFTLPTPLYPTVPILGVVLSLVVISQMAPLIVALGVGIVALGVVWYVAYARDRVVGEGLLREAIRPAPSDVYRVVVPVANPETQRGLLRLAAASARANADVATPELVAVNVHYVEHPSPLQNVEADRADHQRELLDNAHEFAEEMDVRLRTRAVVASDVAEAVLDVIDEEEADELLLGWDGTLDRDGQLFGRTVDDIVDNARCDVALAVLRGDLGRPVGLVTRGADAVAVARRAAEFATVDGSLPTLLTVQPAGDDEDAARRRGRKRLTEVASAARLEADDYRPVVVVADDVAEAILAAVGQYDTVCVGLSGNTEDADLPVDVVADDIVRRVEGTVALVRGERA
jgi:nucleotide-binding universal stress UspA family protein